MATIQKHVTRDVVALDGATPIRQAAQLMADRRIGSIGVKGGGEGIVGLVTERDLVMTVLARRRRQPAHPRGDADRHTARPRERERGGLRGAHARPHAPPPRRGGRARDGVVSMRDIIQLMLDEKQFLIEQLQTYITGR